MKKYVQIRIDGKSREDIYQAAKEMGVNVKSIYPKRGGKGFLGYGWKQLTGGAIWHQWADRVEEAMGMPIPEELETEMCEDFAELNQQIVSLKMGNNQVKRKNMEMMR